MADAEGDVVANLYHVTSNDHPDPQSLVRGLCGQGAFDPDS